MSFNLPDHVELPASPARHNLAIAEIAIFGVILLFQFCLKLVQEWQNWDAHHKHRRHPIRCFFRAWFSILAILCQLRIIGFALYISTKDPAKSVVVAEVVLQSVGTSPLLWELSLVILRCGHAGDEYAKNTTYPKFLETLLRLTRLPIIAAAVLFIVAGCILNTTLLKAGSLVLLATFVYAASMSIFIYGTHHRHLLHTSGQLGMRLAIATLPFYTVRVVYLVLVEFGSIKFSPVLGDWRFLAGMGLAMEVPILLLLIVAGVIIEPLELGARMLPSLPIARRGDSAEVRLDDSMFVGHIVNEGVDKGSAQT